MNKKKKSIIAVISLFLLIIILLSTCHFICSRGKIEIIKEISSPNDDKIASFYSKMGGGAAGYVIMYVNIRDKNKNLSSGENVFEMRHAYEVSISWLDNNRLEIRYPQSASDVVKKTVVDDINILYNVNEKVIDRDTDLVR